MIFNIQTKLLIAFVGLSIIPLIVVEFYSAYVSIQMLREIEVENIRHDVLMMKTDLENFIQEVEKGIYVIEKHLSRMKWDKRREVVGWILDFMETKRIYYSVKFLDSTGSELFKIQWENGEYRVVPEDQLLDTRGTFYKILTAQFGGQRLAFTPAELITDYGSFVPVISCAVQVFKDGKFVGILVANVFASEIFKVIESSSHSRVGEVVVVNNHGYYLYHSEKRKIGTSF